MKNIAETLQIRNHAFEPNQEGNCSRCSLRKEFHAPAPRIEVEATARPWALEYYNGGNVPFVDIVGGRTGDPLSGMVVARWQFPERRPDALIEQDKVNAAFIVQAVNSHQALVDALTHARKMFKYIEGLSDKAHIGNARQQAEQGVRTLTDALALVEKEGAK